MKNYVIIIKKKKKRWCTQQHGIHNNRLKSITGKQKTWHSKPSGIALLYCTNAFRLRRAQTLGKARTVLMRASAGWMNPLITSWCSARLFPRGLESNLNKWMFLLNSHKASFPAPGVKDHWFALSTAVNNCSSYVKGFCLLARKVWRNDIVVVSRQRIRGVCVLHANESISANPNTLEQSGLEENRYSGLIGEIDVRASRSFRRRRTSALVCLSRC